MDFSIRKAEFKDAKGIHEVILAAFEEFRYFYTPEGFADTVMSEEVALNRIQEMNLYVAVDLNGEIIGTIGWLKISKKEEKQLLRQSSVRSTEINFLLKRC